MPANFAWPGPVTYGRGSSRVAVKSRVLMAPSDELVSRMDLFRFLLCHIFKFRGELRDFVRVVLPNFFVVGGLDFVEFC